jgi:hypothetical protein
MLLSQIDILNPVLSSKNNDCLIVIILFACVCYCIDYSMYILICNFCDMASDFSECSFPQCLHFPYGAIILYPIHFGGHNEKTVILILAAVSSDSLPIPWKIVSMNSKRKLPSWSRR